MAALKTEYESLRENINPQLAQLSDAQLESLFERHGVDAEAMEGFFSDLGKFASSAGKAVLGAAPSILPMAGSVVGTMFGGPIGAQIGGSLGSLAGQAVGAASGQKPAAGGAGGLGSLLGGGGLGSLLGGGGGLGSLLGGSSAAGQLLQTVMKPQTMQALASMAMGPAGKPDIPVGGTSVPVGAFGNLLKMLTGRMEAEYAESMARSKGDGTPEYMRDYAGQAKADPHVAANRAEALYELLQFAGKESEQESADAESEAEAEAEYQRAQQEMEAFQAEYDAIELMEVYESEDA
jgi:hypothetical protein